MASGIHHVTAISGPARRNLDFHTRVLGQRCVKRTVNFDDPGTYHLYYGNEDGAPGSILTFFPWDHAAAGRIGVGETMETAFRVPVGALPFWTERLRNAGTAVEPPIHRFGRPVLTFQDPDGMRLALVGIEDLEGEPSWIVEGIAPDHAVRGFYGVTLLVDEAEATGDVLTNVMGFQKAGREGDTLRYTAATAMGGLVDLHVASGLPRGRQSAGSVHHVAFRAADDAAQAAMARKLVEDHGLSVTEQKDRNYFRSVYLREPSGVIFEIATDKPGFAVDEPQASLGAALKLPSFLEPQRAKIESVLPALT